MNQHDSNGHDGHGNGLATAQLAQPGHNRTIRETKDYVERMVEGTEEFPPTSQGSLQDVAQVRIDAARDGVPIGHVPQQGLEDGSDAMLVLLVDKLGERLAFERTGVRLYDALLSKHEAYGGFEGGPAFSDLQRFREDELTHVRLLTHAIKKLDGDPTALTPSADLALTAGAGIVHVLVDPRTTLLQSLEAILIAELADNACWEGLAELAESGPIAELAEDFRGAQEAEREHLESVRSWIAAGQGRVHAHTEDRGASRDL